MGSTKPLEIEDLQTRLAGLADDVAREAGVELVELRLRGSGSRRVLRVDIDRPGAAGVDLADCQRVSRALEAVLDERDLLPFGYVLEVSSPGADRPLRTSDDFRRNVGRRLAVTARVGEGDERQLKGILTRFDGSKLTLETSDGQRIEISEHTVRNARQELEI